MSEEIEFFIGPLAAGAVRGAKEFFRRKRGIAKPGGVKRKLGAGARLFKRNIAKSGSGGIMGNPATPQKFKYHGFWQAPLGIAAATGMVGAASGKMFTGPSRSGPRQKWSRGGARGMIGRVPQYFEAIVDDSIEFNENRKAWGKSVDAAFPDNKWGKGKLGKTFNQKQSVNPHVYANTTGSAQAPSHGTTKKINRMDAIRRQGKADEKLAKVDKDLKRTKRSRGRWRAGAGLAGAAMLGTSAYHALKDRE